LDAWQLALVLLGATLVVYVVFIALLFASGRRSDAGALAGFIPDCLVLFRRLIAEPRVSRWRKALLGGLLAYLAMPFDLVPDFIPVAGQLDDLLLVAVVLRIVLRGGGAELVREHWPGPASSLRLMMKLAYRQTPPPRPPTSNR